MVIDMKDLPPAYQVQALRKLAERERRKKNQTLLARAENETGKPAKYHNKPTERVTDSGAVLRFDSKKEAHRYDELAALERDGEIRELRMQVDFTLQEAYTDTEGRRVRAIRYRADFTYWRYDDQPGGSVGFVVEDVKSSATRTKEYAMKRKLMKERFNIDIQEV